MKVRWQRLTVRQKPLMIFVVICLHYNLTHASDFSAKWASGEHTYLGDVAFDNFCESKGDPALDGACRERKILRRDRRLGYTYGELVALGDVYLDPESMFTEDGMQNIGNGNLKRIFGCFQKDGKVLYEQTEFPEYAVNKCDWYLIFGTRDFLRVSANNYEHFSWNNLVAYVKYHSQAVGLAAKAHHLRRDGQIDQAEEALRQALFYNGYGDHFLTDAFAAGHIRVPRLEVVQWAKSAVKGPLAAYHGHALSMIFHNNDGKDKLGAEVGLRVENARGDRWTTYSDHNLNYRRKEDSSAIDQPIAAVLSSISEVSQAYRSGVTPQGVYTALSYVPWSCSGSIEARFSLPLDPRDRKGYLTHLRNSLPPPLKWVVSRSDIARAIGALPVMLRSFDARIEAELLASPDLRKRLPSSLMAIRHSRPRQGDCGDATLPGN